MGTRAGADNGERSQDWTRGQREDGNNGDTHPWIRITHNFGEDFCSTPSVCQPLLQVLPWRRTHLLSLVVARGAPKHQCHPEIVLKTHHECPRPTTQCCSGNALDLETKHHHKAPLQVQCFTHIDGVLLWSQGGQEQGMVKDKTQSVKHSQSQRSCQLLFVSGSFSLVWERL